MTTTYEKAVCRHCSSHIEFDVNQVDSPELLVECPHCHLETVIAKQAKAQRPPPLPKKPNRVDSCKRNWLIILATVIALISAGFISHSILSTLKLKPVDGAFGFKLGERLPAELASKISYPNEFNPTFSLKLTSELPPFIEATLHLLEDKRIYKITALGNALAYRNENPDDGDKRLVSVLTEKYGLRRHFRLKRKVVFGSPDFPLRPQPIEYYYFGTARRGAELVLNVDSLYTSLTYYDKQLEQMHNDEVQTKRDQRSAPKKPALEKNL